VPGYSKAINYNTSGASVDAKYRKPLKPGKTKRLNIEIRNANPGDQSIIADFNSRLAEETEGKALDPEIIGPGVATALGDPAKARYWLAIADGEVAGQIMVTYEWSDWRNSMLWWIQSVYVPAPFRRQGIFSALFKHVESLARADKDVCGLRLYVERSNAHARETYRALAMAEPGYVVMESLFANHGDT
jgi:GNAT superfamily N-acetyltransferase